jgi:hypothetical protein
MSIYNSDAYEYGVESDCCGASVIYTDICTDCKEHCTPVREDEGGIMDEYRDVGMSPGDFFRQE